MRTLEKAADKVAGKTKQVVAEVIGDGKLREEGKLQEKEAEEKAGDEDKSSLSKITNNLT